MNRKTLYITEFFKSIQGESTLSGVPTAFVRLSGCNLRCKYCDSAYTFERGEEFSLNEVMDQVEKMNCPYVCITGGEPLLQQNVYTLCHELAIKGYKVSIETNGSLHIKERPDCTKFVLDIKCPSSGEEKKNIFENLPILQPEDEVKFVLSDKKDYLYAKHIIEKYNLTNKVIVLLSPVFRILEPRHIVEWMLENDLNVRLNLQLHKVIWPEKNRGV